MPSALEAPDPPYGSGVSSNRRRPPPHPDPVLARGPALFVAIISSAVVLVGVGVYSALTRVGSWWKNGLKMVCIGLGAAALGFAIGRLFHASGG